METIGDGDNVGDNSLSIWECINRFYHSTRKSVNVLVGNNCDAAAASLTFSSLFRSSLISFSLHPVSSYDELRTIIETINVSQDFAMNTAQSSRTDELFVLIGFGAPVSLLDYFDLSRHIVVLLDSQRPIHLQNLRTGAAATSPPDSRFIIWGFSRIQEDVDAFFKRASEQERRKRRRAERKMEARRRRLIEHGADGLAIALIDDDDDDDEDDDEDSNDASDVDSGEEDAAAGEWNTVVDWMNPDGVSLSLQQRYSASQGSCRSCAVELYDLSTLLNRTSDSFVWHAAVGVCDLFRRRCMDYGAYLVEMRPLHDAVALHQGSRRQGMFQSTENGVRSGILADLPINTIQNLRETSSNAMRLFTLDQPPFLLLQHISLWDAMWNDAAVASALGFHHSEHGESTLKLLLAKCGVSLEMALRPWFEVPREDRDAAMRLILQELKPFFSGSRGTMASPNTLRMIGRAVGFSREVTTFDVCVLFDAVLAASPPASLYHVSSELAGDQHPKAVVAKRLSEFYREQFWRAHALVDMDPSRKEFSAAITETVHLHRIIGESASALMQPSLILSTQGLHYIQLNDPGKTASALESFHTPARLQALANRLLHTLTAERGLRRYTRSIRPLLLASPIPREVIQSDKGAEEGNVNGPSSISGEDEIPYLVLMISGGVTGSGLQHSRDLHIFNECVEKAEAFEKLPSRSSVLRECVFVQGRENAIHVAEMMHLRSLEM